MRGDGTRCWNRWIEGSDKLGKRELAHSGTRACGEGSAQRWFDGDLPQRLGKAAYQLFAAAIPGGNYAPAAFINDNAGAAEFGAYHWQSMRHGLQNGHASGIAQAGEQEHVGASIVFGHSVMRDPEDPLHHIGEPEFLRQLL